MTITVEANTVLIIEDVPENSMFLSFVMKRAGYSVVAFGSGEEACVWLEAHRPTIILCDIMLPGMDGIAVLKHIQSMDKLRGIPAIAITALAMPGDKEKLLNAGFHDYIAKPALAGTVLESVKKVLAQ
jgi:CheY-like chemotaxis protein